MGNSANWLKSFMSHKKSNPDDQGKAVTGKRNSKWKLWRRSSSIDSGVSVVAASEPSNSTTSEVDDVYTAAMATLIRAPPKNFLIVRKEWAAIRIQTAFRGLLARRALRALRALVRLQALVRGRLVRKQAAMTLKCMQALVRAQSQIKAHRVRISMEGKSHHPLKQPQQRSKTSDLNQRKKDSFSGPMETHKIDKLCQEIWQMEEAHHLDLSPDSSTSSPLSCKHKKEKPRATAKRVTARQQRRSKFVNDESWSSSSVSSSTTVEGADESDFGRSKPRFMNLTSSKIAKQSPRKVTGYDSTKV